MSSTTAPSKIVLSSSTKISLHERFTKLAKTVVKSDKIKRVETRAPLKSTTRNRKLALQMANRPSVQAALKIKNRTLKQRLGGFKNAYNNNNINRQGNLKTVVRRRLNNNQTKSLKQRLGAKVAPYGNRLGNGRIKIIRSRNQLQQRLGNTNGNTNNNNLKRRNNRNNLYSNRFNNGNNNNNNNNKNNKIIRNNNNGFVINRVNNNNNGFKKRLRFRKNLKGRLQNAGNRSNFRRRTNNGNKKQQQQNNNGQTNGVKTKENLDMDLDNYMKQTKSHLDAELDSYMAQTSANVI